jgi:hypothetical protein
LVKLSGTVKHGAEIRSLPFNPYKLPGFHVYQPNASLMRHVVANAIASGQKSRSSATPDTTAAQKRPTSASSAMPAGQGDGAVSLKNICG